MDWWLVWATLSLCVFQFITCCCGPAACQFAADSFNRADSTDINTGSSCGWTETAGDWSIASNALTVASTSAKATCNTVNPDGPSMSIQVSVKVSSLGDIARIYIDDHYLEMKLAAAAGGYTRLYDASNTLLAESKNTTHTANTFYSAGVCYDDATGRFSGFLTSDGASNFVEQDATITGDTCALGTGGTVAGTVTFDGFSADRVVSGCAACTFCPNCDAGTYPRQLQVAVSGMAIGTNPFRTCANCASYDATYILDQARSSTCTFEYIFTGACTNCWTNSGFPPAGSQGCDDVVATINRTIGADKGIAVEMGWSADSPFGRGWYWQEAWPSVPFDCTTINESVSYPAGESSANSVCSASGATCTVSYIA